MPDHRRRLNIEQKDNSIAVVSFVDSKLLDELNIEVIAEMLNTLADEPKGRTGKRTLIIDFKNVKYLSAAMMDKLITLHKKLGTRGDNLVLTSINPEVAEVFELTRLDKKFGDSYKPQLTADQAVEAATQRGVHSS